MREVTLEKEEEKTEFPADDGIVCPVCGSKAGFAIHNAVIKTTECSDIYILTDGIYKSPHYYNHDVDLDRATVVCLNCNNAIEDFNLKFALALEAVNMANDGNNHIWDDPSV